MPKQHVDYSDEPWWPQPVAGALKQFPAGSQTANLVPDVGANPKAPDPISSVELVAVAINHVADALYLIAGLLPKQRKPRK